MASYYPTWMNLPRVQPWKNCARFSTRSQNHSSSIFSQERKSLPPIRYPNYLGFRAIQYWFCMVRKSSFDCFSAEEFVCGNEFVLILCVLLYLELLVVFLLFDGKYAINVDISNLILAKSCCLFLINGRIYGNLLKNFRAMFCKAA